MARPSFPYILKFTFKWETLAFYKRTSVAFCHIIAPSPMDFLDPPLITTKVMSILMLIIKLSSVNVVKILSIHVNAVF